MNKKIAIKISKTFKKKKIDNFKKWRDTMRVVGKIPSSYGSLKRDQYLAFLIGIILGDGHICVFPRTEKLEIALGTNRPKLIELTKHIVELVFHKTPTICYPKHVNLARVMIYQKNISKRLKIPTGDRSQKTFKIPSWIVRKKLFYLSYLRGLYEAEASLCVHLQTSTYNFAFHNKNISLLGNVENLLKKLRLHPEKRSNAVRLRRKDEVKYFVALIKFRVYPTEYAGWSNGSLVAL